MRVTQPQVICLLLLQLMTHFIQTYESADAAQLRQSDIRKALEDVSSAVGR
jgi:hypothetical protein